MRRLVLVALGLLAAATPAHARPGDLDRTFGYGGRVAQKVWGTGGGNVSLALVGGQRPLLSVSAYRGSALTPALLQLTARGRLGSRKALDTELAPTFSGGYALTPLGPENSVSIQYRLARIGSSRSVTLTMPRADIYEIYAFGRDGAGRTVLSGQFGRNGGIVLRFLPSGALDTSFGTGGQVEHDVGGNELIVKRDGRIFVADAVSLVALDSKGRRVKGFANGRVPKPPAADAWINAVAEGPGGTFLVAGASEFRGWVARLQPTGRLDRRFGKDGFLYRPTVFNNTQIEAIARDRRGRWVLAGTKSEYPASDAYTTIVLRLTPRGQLDRSFGKRGAKLFRLGVAPGLGISGSGADSVAIDDRDRIVVAGEVFDDDFEFREDVGSPYPAIARLLG